MDSQRGCTADRHDLTYTLLVADDDRAIRESLERALSLEGYRVIGADDGVQVLTRIRHETFDTLVIDVMMPNLDGLGVLQVPQGGRLPRTGNHCVAVLKDLWHDAGHTDGCSTNGSSEAAMITASAFLRRWRDRGGTGRPSLVLGPTAHLCWLRFCAFWDVGPVCWHFGRTAR